ncbi:MAG TPA: PilZ domain-containing protein [Thermodesulfovibrionales bacterium]|nr:PilZ domain-containing protein [Thermodesulfovibrionales bacterium]
MVNRRRHKRFIKHCDVEFFSGGMGHAGTSSNFSLQGMFIRTDHPQAPGTVLDILLYLPYGEISKLRGKVKRAWTNPAGAGVRRPKNGKIGMGVEVIEKDASYLHFIRYLLNWSHLSGIFVARQEKRGEIYATADRTYRECGLEETVEKVPDDS